MKNMKFFLNLSFLLFISIPVFSSEQRLKDIEFVANEKAFVMKPIHTVSQETLTELMSVTLFSPLKENNYKYYEDGQPWNLERAENSLKTKIARSQKWETDPTQFSWYIIFDENKKAQGFLATYLEPSGEYEGYVQIAYAKDTYDSNSKGMMTVGYQAFMKDFIKDFKELDEKFKGLYAPVHPENKPSEKWIKNLGFMNSGFIEEKNRNIWILSSAEFFKSIA